jgi:hypothetical protein
MQCTVRGVIFRKAVKMNGGDLRLASSRSEPRLRTRGLSRFAARVEHALFAATLAGMAYLYLGPLLAQVV